MRNANGQQGAPSKSEKKGAVKQKIEQEQTQQNSKWAPTTIPP